MTLAQKWIKLRVLYPAEYKQLDAEYRARNKKKIRQRVKDWKKSNRERYNAWQRETYRLLKEELSHGKEKNCSGKTQKGKSKEASKCVREKSG